jgi:hypothetical protein
MTCLQKYRAFRDKIQDGDIGLVWSNKPLARAIQHVDGAFYHHSFVAFKKFNRVFCMDAHPDKGVNPAYLSHRIEQQKWKGMIFLRPNTGRIVINNALCRTFELADSFIPYDFVDILRILQYQYTGRWKQTATEKMICSEFTQYYCINLGFENHHPDNLKRPFFTPQDHLRVMDNGQFTILEP